MTAKEYLETKKRMTNECSSPDVCNASCPLSGKRNKRHVECSVLETEYPDEAIAIVQKWGEEHPVKTLMEKFFEVFPNAPKHGYGMPKQICVQKVGYKSIGNCQGSHECLKCWSQPYREPKE